MELASGKLVSTQTLYSIYRLPRLAAPKIGVPSLDTLVCEDWLVPKDSSIDIIEVFYADQARDQVVGIRYGSQTKASDGFLGTFGLQTNVWNEYTLGENLDPANSDLPATFAGFTAGLVNG